MKLHALYASLSSRLKATCALGVTISLGFGLIACAPGGFQESTSTSRTTPSQAMNPSENIEGEWPRVVETDDGEVTIENRPQRIVSTSTTLTGSLLAIDAPVIASAATLPNNPGLSDDQGFFIQWSQEAQDKGVAKLWENAAPRLENIVNYDPDLIIVSKNSGDSVFEQVEQLRKIATVVVVDYSGSSWQNVASMMGRVTGREAEADKVIKNFGNYLEEVKREIDVPKEETSPFMIFGDNSGAAALTEHAPQTQILESLGFNIATVPDEVKGDTSMGAQRSDIVQLSLENVQKGLPGKVWIAVAADDKNKDFMAADPAFNTAEAYKNGQVYYTPVSTFRLDYFSAQEFLNSIKESF